MSAEFLLSVVFRWAHILAAVIAVGGTIFIRFVLMPTAAEVLGAEQHAAQRAAIMKRWQRWIMVCIALLLFSGLYNFVTLSLPRARGVPVYHALFGVKFLAALGVFFIASALTGRSKVFEGMRAHSRKWMTLNVILAVLVVLISGVLKNLPAAP
jgi:uncharacterized membrane protein